MDINLTILCEWAKSRPISGRIKINLNGNSVFLSAQLHRKLQLSEVGCTQAKVMMSNWPVLFTAMWHPTWVLRSLMFLLCVQNDEKVGSGRRDWVQCRRHSHHVCVLPFQSNDFEQSEQKMSIIYILLGSFICLLSFSRCRWCGIRIHFCSTRPTGVQCNPKAIDIRSSFETFKRRTSGTIGKTRTIRVEHWNRIICTNQSNSCVADNALGRTKKYIEISGRPGPAEFISPTFSGSLEYYNLTWSVESIPPLEEIRLLYRRLMVRPTAGRPREKADYSPLHSFADERDISASRKMARHLAGSDAHPIQRQSLRNVACDSRPRAELGIWSNCSSKKSIRMEWGINK